MKKVVYIIIILITFILFGLSHSVKAYDMQTQKDISHQIAELARAINLPETDAIIVRAQELWWEAEKNIIAEKSRLSYKPIIVEEPKTYSNEDLRILATVIHYEARGCPDRHQQLVAQVVLNRVADSRFPNTIKAVVEQPGQYSAKYTRSYPNISQKCYDNARLALEGKVDCPSNVVFQAQFRQGTGVYEISYVNTGYWSSTTYFCYG